MSFRIPRPHMLISTACQGQMTSYTCNDVTMLRCGADRSHTSRLRHIHVKIPLISSPNPLASETLTSLVTHLINPLNPELNPICYLLALLGAHHFLHVSRIRVKSLTFRLLMSYIYGAPILDVSRSHTTTQHSR